MEFEGQNNIIKIFTQLCIVPTDFQTYVINDLESVQSSFKYELYHLRKLKFRKEVDGRIRRAWVFAAGREQRCCGAV